MATAQKPIDDDSFKFKLNGSDFFCYFLLSGNEDAPAPDAFSGQTVEEGILLTKSSIVSLDIHENFFAPEIVGSITINNPYNYIEDELPFIKALQKSLDAWVEDCPGLYEQDSFGICSRHNLQWYNLAKAIISHTVNGP